MSIETLLVVMAMGITLLTGLAIRSAMRGRPRRTSNDSAWPAGYATDTSGDSGSFGSYSGSDDRSGSDNCSDTSDSGGWDSGGCDAGGGDSGAGDSGGGDGGSSSD